MSWEDSIYFIDLVHLLEGKISQNFVICDEEGKVFNLSKPDQVMERCDSFSLLLLL